MGQHKFNPVAKAAKEGKIPPKQRRASSASIRHLIEKMFAVKAIGGDEIFAEIAEQTPADHPMLQPPKKVKAWEELDGLVSWDGRYKIEVDIEGGNGQIVPTFEVPDGEYWDHCEYLSTHTFYEKTHRAYTAVLRRFGFNVELVSWG